MAHWVPLPAWRTAVLSVLVSIVASACSSGASPAATAPPSTSQPSSAASATPTSPPYPTKAITIIVPFDAGGPADLSARLVAEYASKQWGQPVQVVNVSGASGITGSLQALQADPDGYTMLLDSSATSSVLDATHAQLPFKLEDRAYGGRISTDSYYFVASTSTGWKTLADVKAAVTADPGSFTWGAGAAGSSLQFLGLQLLDAFGVDIDDTKMVIFEGGNAPNVQALAGGNVQFIPTVAADAQTLVSTGKGVILAVADTQRTKVLPDVPTTVEAGFATATLGTWQAIAGRGDLPAYVLDAWDALLAQASTDQAFLDAAVVAKRTVAYVPGDEWRAFVIAQRDNLLPLAEASGLRQ